MANRDYDRLPAGQRDRSEGGKSEMGREDPIHDDERGAVDDEYEETEDTIDEDMEDTEEEKDEGSF